MDPCIHTDKIHSIDNKVTEIHVDIMYIKEKIDGQEGVLSRNTADVANHIRRTDLLQAQQASTLETLQGINKAMESIENRMEPMARHLLYHAWGARLLYLAFGGSLLLVVRDFSQILEIIKHF